MKRKPVEVSRFLALKPSARHYNTLMKVHEQLTSADENIWNDLLYLASLPYSTSEVLRHEPREYRRLTQITNALKHHLRIKKKNLTKLTESTGLFTLNVGYALDKMNYPNNVKIYAEPEVMINYATYKLDYAIIRETNENNYELLLLAEVKRLSTTNNIDKYTEASFTTFKNIIENSDNYFNSNRPLVLHIHLSPPLSGNRDVYQTLRALDKVSIFNEGVRVLVTTTDISNFTESFHNLLYTTILKR